MIYYFLNVFSIYSFKTQTFLVSRICIYILFFFLRVYSHIITKRSVIEIYIRVGGMYCRLLQSLHYFPVSWGSRVIHRNVGTALTCDMTSHRMAAAVRISNFSCYILSKSSCVANSSQRLQPMPPDGLNIHNCHSSSYHTYTSERQANQGELDDSKL
jgi:hypothetical protein